MVYSSGMYPLLSPCSIHKLRLGKPQKLPPCLMKLSVYPPWLCSLCAKTLFVVDLLAVLRMPNFNQSYRWVLTMPNCQKKMKLEECFQSSNHLYEGVAKVYLWLVFCILWKIFAYFKNAASREYLGPSALHCYIVILGRIWDQNI